MSLFKEELIQFAKKVSDWKEAIVLASKPLVNHGYVKEEFSQKIIQETERLGPYYLLAKDLALAHISPDGSTFKNGISLLYLDQPIAFKDDQKHNVKFLFVLSAIDQNSHLKLLQELALLFGNKNFYQAFYQVKSFAEIQTLVKTYLK
jgi:PTS system ascorbate-specific IIA component